MLVDSRPEPLTGIKQETAEDASVPWTRVITPRRPWWDIPLKELWSYRDLIWMLAHRDVATSYKQTVLGPLWYLIQPFLVTAVFSYLFGRMANFGSDDIPHYLFYMGGLVPWTFFSETALKTSGTFVVNSQLFSKVYFPRLAAPLAALLTNVLPLAIQWLLFLVGLLYYLFDGNRSIQPNWWILATPLIFVQLGMFSFGLGCIVSAATNRFRDLAFGVKVGLQLWMFGSAVVFPLSRVGAADRWIFMLNPVVPPIEAFRYAFLGRSLVTAHDIVLSAVISTVVCVVGIILFNQAEQTAMDTV